MNLLCIDAGNTRVKWAVHDGARWSLRGASETARVAAGEPPAALGDVAVERAIVSNVAGATVAAAIAAACRIPAGDPVFIAAEAARCGVSNRYQTPAQLGSDRWAALIAAHAAARRAPRTQLVVMAGTALTVDMLTADGVFLGGIIVPGLALMQSSLHRATALLPAESGQYHTFPGNSVDAVTSGAIEAACGAIQRVYAHLAAHSDEAPHCIGSGGALKALNPHLPFPVTINDNLVLDGLVEISRTNP
jgi:type III pantothenate kinase